MGDVVKIDLGSSGDRLVFSKERGVAGFPVSDSANVAEFPNRRASGAGAKLHIVESEVASCERR